MKAVATGAILQKRQFGTTPRFKKDPSSDDEHDKPRFTGGSGSKTMYPHKGRLPKAPTKHPHHHHAGRRTRRAH
jgi:hypothetical protein